MSKIAFERIDIPDAYVIHSFRAGDKRGWFIKNFEKGIFFDNGLEFNCSEDFTSISYKNVIRGMHFQTRDPQAKLVSCNYGLIYDVLVDLRRDSAHFGCWYGTYLSSDNAASLYVPRGCAHGFLAVSDVAVVNYKCDGAYDKESDTGIPWNDPDIGINWPLESTEQVIISARDQNFNPVKWNNIGGGGGNIPGLLH